MQHRARAGSPREQRRDEAGTAHDFGVEDAVALLLLQLVLGDAAGHGRGLKVHHGFAVPEPVTGLNGSAKEEVVVHLFNNHAAT